MSWVGSVVVCHVTIIVWLHPDGQEQQAVNAGWRSGRLQDSVYKLKLREEQEGWLGAVALRLEAIKDSWTVHFHPIYGGLSFITVLCSLLHFGLGS